MKRLVNQQQIFGKVINFKEAIKILRSISHLDVAGLSDEILQKGQFNLLSYGIKKTKQILFLINFLLKIRIEFSIKLILK